MPQSALAERIHLNLSLLPLFHLSLHKVLPSAAPGGFTFLFHPIGWSKRDLRERLATFAPSGVEMTVEDSLSESTVILSLQLRVGEPDAPAILELTQSIVTHLLGS